MRRVRSFVSAGVLGGVIAACAAREPVMTSRPVEVQNLIGSEWLAEDIDGAGVAGNSHSTLHFAAADHVDGDTGCNRFMGPLAAEGQSIRIGPLATTRRACAPALMDQERRYLVALARGSGLRLDGALLVLLDESQQPLVRYSRVDPTAIPTRP
jgi:heat shock protein HslJ